MITVKLVYYRGSTEFITLPKLRLKQMIKKRKLYKTLTIEVKFYPLTNEEWFLEIIRKKSRRYILRKVNIVKI